LKIHLLHARARKQQVTEMLEALGNYIKLAVDVRRGVLAGGGVLHADCEAALLDHGSQQEDIWGADWIPETDQVRYEALINIRPGQGNPSMEIVDATVREQVGGIVRGFLEGV
jgi:hypothetical protein